MQTFAQKIIPAVVVGLAGLTMAFAAHAHHSFAWFDTDKTVTYDGFVISFAWGNPHTHVILKVPPGATDPTTIGTWDIEGAATNIMARQGWTRKTLQPGDHIQIVGHPMKDGSKGASLFYVILPDGRRIYQDIARPKDDAAAK